MEKEKVYRVGCNWIYFEDQDEAKKEHWEESKGFDETAYVSVYDQIVMQVCVIRKGKKYGIYTLDRTHGMGGSGIFCNPTLNPFPYDEVKCCASIDDGYGFFAFRIGKKWGIIKIVAFNNKEEGVYDAEYYATKRRIIVPCEYVALADAELQLRMSLEWGDPFKDEFAMIYASVPNRKKGTQKADDSLLRVTFPNGTVIQEDEAVDTFEETIDILGVERVSALNIMAVKKHGILLIDTKPTTLATYRSQQHEIKPGYFLMTKNRTDKKAEYLEDISERLHAGLKVEVIP